MSLWGAKIEERELEKKKENQKWLNFCCGFFKSSKYMDIAICMYVCNDEDEIKSYHGWGRMFTCSQHLIVEHVFSRQIMGPTEDYMKLWI